MVSPTITPEVAPLDSVIENLNTTQDFDFPVDLKELSQNFEIDLINQALADSQFNQKKTADKLGLTYHQLRGYLKKYNLLEQTNEDLD
jgi:psp operon transcriptional activator